MTDTPCFIGIDIGTSTCKVLAIDTDGRVLARATRDYPLSTPRPGWAEQNPEDWWNAADASVRAVVAALPRPGAVAAIGLSGQMHGLVALDDADRVLRPAMLWCDQRAAPQCEDITARMGGLSALMAHSSNRMLPGFTGGKLVWMREHEPDLFARLRHMLNPKDYLRLRMTGLHATDVSEASGTGLFDVRRRCWSLPLLEAVGLTLEQVPDAYESQAVTGRLLPDLAEHWGLPAGTPVVGGGGDAVIQTTGMGVVEPGPLGVTIGTAGIVAAAARICPDNPDGLLQISCGNAPDRWHVMGVAQSAGGAFQWLRETVRQAGADLDFARLVALADPVPPGAQGLLFLPFLMGERCPHMAPDARAAWIGLSRSHGLAHMARAVMEGVLFNLRAIQDLFARSGLPCTGLLASGGATASPVWLQMLADIFGREVRTLSGASEGGAYGAALLAGVGHGRWSGLDEAVSVLEETSRTASRPAVAAAYGPLYPLHASLYHTLQGVFAEIAAIEWPAGEEERR